MSKPSITNIKAGIVLGMALGFVTMNGTNVTISAIARTGNDQNPAIPEEKPFDQKQALADLRKKIAGQEDKPSAEVFQNIQIPLFKKLPAKLLLGAMEFVFSKSLGVDCRHCHVIDQWEKDDKPTKPVARDMYDLMMSLGNNLAKIKNLKSARPIVTCYTCHRGQTKPEIELPELKPKQ